MQGGGGGGLTAQGGGADSTGGGGGLRAVEKKIYGSLHPTTAPATVTATIHDKKKN